MSFSYKAQELVIAAQSGLPDSDYLRFQCNPDRHACGLIAVRAVLGTESMLHRFFCTIDAADAAIGARHHTNYVRHGNILMTIMHIAMRQERSQRGNNQ